MSAAQHVPSPADAPTDTAAEFLSKVEERNGRVFRMMEPPRVYVLTTNPATAEWLIRRGGRVNAPVNLRADLMGAYRRSKTDEINEWDVWISSVPVQGEETLWEAAGAFRGGKRA